jgi:hypothetical protein
VLYALLREQYNFLLSGPDDPDCPGDIILEIDCTVETWHNEPEERG